MPLATRKLSMQKLKFISLLEMPWHCNRYATKRKRNLRTEIIFLFENHLSIVRMTWLEMTSEWSEMLFPPHLIWIGISDFALHYDFNPPLLWSIKMEGKKKREMDKRTFSTRNPWMDESEWPGSSVITERELKKTPNHENLSWKTFDGSVWSARFCIEIGIKKWPHRGLFTQMKK